MQSHSTRLKNNTMSKKLMFCFRQNGRLCLATFTPTWDFRAFQLPDWAQWSGAEVTVDGHPAPVQLKDKTALYIDGRFVCNFNKSI